MDKKNKADFIVIASVLALVLVGIIMVFSASYTQSLIRQQDGRHYLRLMIQWSLIGTIVMFIFSKIKFIIWKRWAPFIIVVSVALLMILIYSPFGAEVKGATRWLRFGSIQFMPSEVAKIGLIIFLSASIEERQYCIKNIITGQLPYIALLAGMFYLIMQQPDFSTAIVFTVITFSLLFVGGMHLFQFSGLVLAGVGGFGYIIYQAVFLGLSDNYRARRLISFTDPWQNAQGDGYQIIQSLYAIGSGGFFGRGLGNSIQKHSYLPEAHNDFIFSVIGEELGFIGSSVVLLLFAILIWRGIKIAMNAPDLFSSLLATGIVAMISVQVIINVGVATASLPVTGMSLPFISYGGSSLVIFMGAIGILLNISRYCSFPKKEVVPNKKTTTNN